MGVLVEPDRGQGNAGPSWEPERAALAALESNDREETLAILMRAYGVQVYRFCRQMLRDACLAEDALQNTFLAAYRDFARFEHRSSFKTWLYGIAAHRCQDLLKKRRRAEARFVAMDPLPEPSRGTATNEERVAAQEAERALETCLERLAPQARLAVLLRYREGLSYPEMAGVCQAQPATLQARVARALPALRRCVEGLGVSL